MALNFPPSPSVNDEYTDPNGAVWRWNGSYWQAVYVDGVLWFPTGSAGLMATKAGASASSIGVTAYANDTGKIASLSLSADSGGDYNAELKVRNGSGGTLYALGLAVSAGGTFRGPRVYNGGAYVKVWYEDNDGAGSGLDADLLDGQQGAYYLPAGSYTAADVLSKLLTVDGSGSGLDADTVDGVGAAASTYTPTLSNTTNVAASTAFVCQYLRVGNTVTVSGKVNIDPTAAGATLLGISLPVASAFTSDEELCGTAALSGGASQESGAIYADATNDRASLSFYAVTTSNSAWYFTFTYRVI